MQTSAAQITTIQKRLAILPEEKLKEVVDFVEFMLSQSQVEHKRTIKLGGIWKNLGFEKFANLDAEIRKIRQETSHAILNKEL